MTRRVKRWLEKTASRGHPLAFTQLAATFMVIGNGRRHHLELCEELAKKGRSLYIGAAFSCNKVWKRRRDSFLVM